MPRNSSASVFGGAGGRGVKASVSNLEGLRKVLRNEAQTDSAPVTPTAAPVTASQPNGSPVSTSLPEDNKQELQTLNSRLKNYLDRVQQLKEDNGKLKEEIDDILAKRKAPESRDWDEIQKPQDALDKKIKELTMDNAKLLLQIDNYKLALEDFNNKLNHESKMKKELEKDIDTLKKDIEDTKQTRDQLQNELELVKDEVERLEADHKKEVAELCEKIKTSEVKVEIDSQNSNLADMIKNIREHYQKLADRNMKETEDWYKDKFDNIQVKEAQNNKDLETEKTKYNLLLKEKKSLEMQIQASHTTIQALKDNLNKVMAENNNRLVPFNNVIVSLQAELKDVRVQVEQKVESYKKLLCLKMKLEKEIQDYDKLICVIADKESMELSLKEALQQEPPTPNNQDDEGVDEVLVDDGRIPNI
ncbi:keratin, type I cytoskeletal 18-like isoform X1 [Xiphophorus couchianus]|uniref:keratin, type I cytoskeletal 18-like isoform X1 n=1 Tax=Xiphophorus couchianus TaxID=32473 RepID=UPI001016EF6E|nr:keratin, type I cytoskeletal 18-like isoform X1 [Xiphophorus couchianus]